MRHLSAASIYFLFGTLCHLAYIPNSAAEPIDSSWRDNCIHTSSGFIDGAVSQPYPDVVEYLGVPYAAPPVGSLRFASPERFIGHGHIDATKQPASCIQTPSTINKTQPENWQHISQAYESVTNHTSEDCLYLNIWAKKTGCHPERPKPVMIWIYGGGFHSGSASDSSQQGAIWAHEQDVIFVNFNYRLGIFGFSGAPGSPQNVAFLDQRMAVEWVRENIAAFGGDPSRITIFGQSSGSASVDFYDFAWSEDPIIAGSIAMSGSVNSFGRRFSNTSAAGWSTTAELVGCSQGTKKSPESEIMSCMRSVNPEKLLDASLKASVAVAETLDKEGQLYASITSLFGPTIDNVTVWTNYTERAAAGKFIHRPSVFGSNIDEGCLFAENGQLPANVTVELGVTGLVFTCPLYFDGVWRASAGVPVWKYSYEGAYPNLYAPVCPGKPWHGQEVYVMFGSTAIVTRMPATEAEINMGVYFRKSFAAFAADPKNGLSVEMHWPTFNKDPSVAALLGGNSSIETVHSTIIEDKLCLSRFRTGAPNF